MGRKKAATLQNEYLVGYQLEVDGLIESYTVIANSPSEAEQKFVSATRNDVSSIRNILKTGELAII